MIATKYIFLCYQCVSLFKQQMSDDKYGCDTMLEIVIEFVIKIVIEIGILVPLWLGLCRFFTVVEQGTLK